ncbi:major outer membrane protein [Arcobacter vandammei]|uniref:major outer membrane protein n=1 Tax=Arcobacter vandammei TaxID=2782243 RepID=UPI0018DF85DD|nr:major outer membrane protein [Arcobacter vandammei]
MRKISKLSLVAAVAVAGFSTANAQPLEEAIKNVEVSGSVVYRYDNFDDEKGSRTEMNRYKIGLNLSSKVNDYVKFNSRFIVGDKHNMGWASANGSGSGLSAKKDGIGDGSADVNLSQAYFGLTAIPNTVVNIGKQGLATPYTVAVDINGNEQSGTGILALTTIDAITLGAGYFNSTNIDKSGEGASVGNGIYTTKTTVIGQDRLGYDVTTSTTTEGKVIKGGSDVYVATIQGDLDFVKLEAWYLGMQDTFNSYTLAATGKVDLAENAKLDLEARYVNLKLDSDTGITGDDRKNDMFRAAVAGKFDIVNARVAYTRTGKHGGLTAVDQDAKNASLGWAINSFVTKANYWQLALGADILDNLNFTLNYGDLRSKENYDNTKEKEIYGQLTYKMSKNLNTYLRYGNYTEKDYGSGNKNIDQNMGRLQVAYTF